MNKDHQVWNTRERREKGANHSRGRRAEIPKRIAAMWHKFQMGKVPNIYTMDICNELTTLIIYRHVGVILQAMNVCPAHPLTD